MAGIRVQKGNKPTVEFSSAVLLQTKKLAEEWEGRPDQIIAKMLHRAIPAYNMRAGIRFNLAIDVPGGKKASIPLETIESSQVNIIDLVPQGKIHFC